MTIRAYEAGVHLSTLDFLSEIIELEESAAYEIWYNLREARVLCKKSLAEEKRRTYWGIMTRPVYTKPLIVRMSDVLREAKW